ncbi:hypothetical protein C8Q73DRAFT_311581 [Cubamyces lactineus]|nr:hypothetical protein C8Q73DRAFT_311581 [Cubamyces lactineus]
MTAASARITEKYGCLLAVSRTFGSLLVSPFGVGRSANQRAGRMSDGCLGIIFVLCSSMNLAQFMCRPKSYKKAKFTMC